MRSSDGFPVTELETIKKYVILTNWIYRQVSQPYKEKITKLQHEIENKYEKGKELLSNDELNWLIKTVENDEEFVARYELI